MREQTWHKKMFSLEGRSLEELQESLMKIGSGLENGHSQMKDIAARISEYQALIDFHKPHADRDTFPALVSLWEDIVSRAWGHHRDCLSRLERLARLRAYYLHEIEILKAERRKTNRVERTK